MNTPGRRWHRHVQNPLVLIVVVVFVGSIGAYLLASGHAASPYAATIASKGTLNAYAAGCAESVSNSSADGGASVIFDSSAGTTAPQVPAGAFNVQSYGADPGGSKDSSVAIRAAIAAAEAASIAKSTTAPATETVYFPAGTYILNNADGLDYDSSTKTYINTAPADFVIDQPDINIVGAGQSTTKLIEEVGNAQTINGQPGPYPDLARGRTVFNFTNQAADFYFSGLTVDSQTYNAGDTVDDSGNCSTIENDTFLGAINGNGGAGSATNPAINDVFDMRVVAFCNPDPTNKSFDDNPGSYHYGNTVQDVNLISQGGFGGNDDLDFTCQKNGAIRNINDTGWGTALYIDENVTVDDYTFKPGGDTKDSQYFAGFYITNGRNIAINGFTTSGQGGIINSPNYPSENITITNEKMLAGGYNLHIGDASNVVVSGSTISEFKLAPGGTEAATAYNPAGGIHGLTVSPAFKGSVSCSSDSPIDSLSGIACP
jgi:hypothetical protein